MTMLRFLELYNILHPRKITEFSYRYETDTRAHVFTTFTVDDRQQEVKEILDKIKAQGMYGWDLSDNEVAKTHARFLVGGRSEVKNERVFRFEFPERPGALRKFLNGLRDEWNISLFHYRNIGADNGKVLLGMQVPPQQWHEFDLFLSHLAYPYVEETNNVVYRQFLRH